MLGGVGVVNSSAPLALRTGPTLIQGFFFRWRGFSESAIRWLRKPMKRKRQKARSFGDLAMPTIGCVAARVVVAAEFDHLFPADLNSPATRAKTVAKLGRGEGSPVRPGK